MRSAAGRPGRVGCRRPLCRPGLWWLGIQLTVFLAPQAAAAQTTGRIEGWVTDGEGRPLAGVTISATSPSLPGAQRAVSDDQGAFRLLALPPGDYRVGAALTGFHDAELAGLRVPLDGAAVVELQLSRAFVEEITVVGTAPVIDAAGATRGADFPREVFEALPVPRASAVTPFPQGEGANSLAVLAPGVVPHPIAGGLVSGASWTESRYLVERLDTTDPFLGSAGVSFPFEFVDEVEVKTGSYGVEYGGALAGVVNVLTRSGGNEFHGDLFAYYRDQGGQSGEFGESGGFEEYDYGVTAGGKLVRDRLWYFLALNPGKVESEKLSAQQIALTDTWESLRFASKLTWQANASHRLSASAFGVGYEDDRFEARAAGLHGDRQRRRAPAAGLTWDGTLGANLLVEAAAGRFQVEHEMNTLNDSVPVYWDLTGGAWAQQEGCGDPALLAGEPEIFFNPGCVGGSFIQDPNDTSRDQLRASVSWFRGRHELKAGTELRSLRQEAGLRYPGPLSGPLVDADGVVIDPDGLAGGEFVLLPGCPFPEVRDCYFLEEFTAIGSPRAQEYGLFLEDRLRLKGHVTIDLGLRADTYRSRVREIGGEAHELDFDLDEMLAPRLGLLWDFAGNGRSKLFAQAGRYYESTPLVTSLAAFAARGVDHYFLYPADGSLPSYDNLGTFLFSDFWISEPEPVVAGTRPTHTDEVSLGVEWELRPGWALGLRGVSRELDDVIEDYTIAGSLLLGNPGGTYTAHPVTGEPLAEAVTYDEPVRRYRALELTLDRRLWDRWQLHGSYVYSQNEGNYTGLEVAAHWTGQFDLPHLTSGGFGPLPNDRPHQVKAYGSYAWPVGLVVGFVGQYYSGTPISRLGYEPEFFYDRFVEPRGSAGRTPALWKVDLHLSYPWRVSRDALTLDFVLDAFNVTDEQAATEVDERWTFATGEGVNPGECGGDDPSCVDEDGNPLGNPNWGQPTRFQQGRSLRFGVKLRW